MPKQKMEPKTPQKTAKGAHPNLPLREPELVGERVSVGTHLREKTAARKEQLCQDRVLLLSETDPTMTRRITRSFHRNNAVGEDLPKNMTPVDDFVKQLQGKSRVLNKKVEPTGHPKILIREQALGNIPKTSSAGNSSNATFQSSDEQSKETSEEGDEFEDDSSDENYEPKHLPLDWAGTVQAPANEVAVVPNDRSGHAEVFVPTPVWLNKRRRTETATEGDVVATLFVKNEQLRTGVATDEVENAALTLMSMGKDTNFYGIVSTREEEADPSQSATQSPRSSTGQFEGEVRNSESEV